MNKIYFKFSTIRRGLQYYYISGISQSYDKDTVCFVTKNRPFNSLLYVMANKIEFIFKDSRYTFKKGNLIYVPKWTDYNVIISGIDNDGQAVIQTFFNIKDELNNEFFYSDNPEKILDSTPKTIVENMKSITNATVNLLYPSFVIMKNLFTIFEYISIAETQTLNAKDKKKSISLALTHITSNLSENTSVSALAKMCGMSETAFRSAFKSEVGMSPCNYKNFLKIQKCMDLIAHNPGISVSRITEELGFNDESYFYKVFYKYANVTYSEFKAKYQ